MAQIVELDALVVGGGFGGVYQLKRLREEGFTVKLLERGNGYGGVWYWNRYPGARVDQHVPEFQFSQPEIWSDWTWSERFPGHEEMRRYFDHVADVWDLRKDTRFGTDVTSATWDEAESGWTVTTNTRTTYRCQFFLPNTGTCSKRYYPAWKGRETFNGVLLHTSDWPIQGLNLKGKRVAVVGTGSTGVSLIQKVAPLASSLTVFQRTPNLAMPLGQKKYRSKDDEEYSRDQYPDFFAKRTETFGGLEYGFIPKSMFDVSEEERIATFESLWSLGDFRFWLGGYHDLLFDEKANTVAYNFWRDKTRSRLSNERLKDKLAPMVKPHAFGTKRCALEDGYFEVFNQLNVQLVDVNDTPIKRLTEKGIETSEGLHEFDVIITATGFDAVTGGFIDMNIEGRGGLRMDEHWQKGARTYMGMCVAEFPNMFYTSGPQAPTALCNAPTCAELQGDWIATMIRYLRDHKLESITATRESEDEWTKSTQEIAKSSLLPKTKSWYMGDNVPGKPRECLFWLGGVPAYYKIMNECAANGYSGFELK